MSCEDSVHTWIVCRDVKSNKYLPSFWWQKSRRDWICQEISLWGKFLTYLSNTTTYIENVDKFQIMSIFCGKPCGNCYNDDEDKWKIKHWWTFQYANGLSKLEKKKFHNKKKNYFSCIFGKKNSLKRLQCLFIKYSLNFFKVK